MAIKKEKTEKSTKKTKQKDEAVQDENIFSEESHTEETVEETTDSEQIVEQNDNTNSEPVMTVTAVEEMLKKQEERWSQRLNKVTALFKADKGGEVNSDTYVADLEDDWLDIPAVFFAYSINYSIHGDKKRGVESKPPQGAVRFEPIVRQKRKGQKGEEVISVSSVKVHSKTVADYLRNHSQFGIAFFEDMDAVLNLNAGWAQKLIEANSSINRLSDQQIIARCKQEGLPVTTDVIQMRKTLVEKIAEKSIAQQDQMLYGKLRKAVIDQKTGFEIIEK